MGMELGIIFAFGAMIFWGIGEFFIQKNVKKEGCSESLLFIGFFALVVLLPFVWKEIPALMYLPNLLLILFLGIITYIASMLNFRALKEGKLSVVEVVFEIELIVTILLGIFIFQERLSWVQWLVVSFIFIGIILMAVKKHHLKNPRLFLEKGVLIGFLGALFMGGVNFFTASSARQMSPVMAIWGPAVVFSILCLIGIGRQEGFVKMKENFCRFKWLILLMGLLDVLAWMSYAFATRTNEVGIITAITESYPAICLILGLWINKEKILFHQYIGASLALVCSFILGFLL